MTITLNPQALPQPKTSPIALGADLISRGFAVFPLIENEKRPAIATGFKAATKDITVLEAWLNTHPNANIGIATGTISGIWVLDVDVKNGTPGLTSLAEIQQKIGQFPTTLTCKTGSGGLHLYFCYPKTGAVNCRTGVLPGIDVRGDGGYCVASPSVVAGNTYEWIDKNAPIAEAPVQLIQLIQSRANNQTAFSVNAANDHIAQGSRNERLMELAVQQMKKGNPREKVQELVLDANGSLCTPPLEDQEVLKIIDNVFRLYGGQMSAHFTDMGNAQRMASIYGNDIRFVAETGQWLKWNGDFWEVINKLEIEALAKTIPASLHAEADQMTDGALRKALKKHATASEGAQRLQYMIELFKSEPKIATKVAHIDQHGFLFPVQNGVIDLKSGKFKEATRNLMITQVSGVRYEPEAICPRFEAFLLQTMNNDKDVVRYLQRAIGYTLTASNTEQCLFFLYGFGANGKSTFLNILRALFGALGTQAAGETLLEQNRSSSGPSGDLARLRGKRFVALSEIDDGKQFAEGLFKSLTGGDAITARYLYKDIFEFVPVFKLWLAANHKPTIKGNGYSIWRRMRLIPFTVTFKKEDQDPLLEQKLREELPGILNWAVRGCLDWQQHGLEIPEAIRKATEDYRAEMDVIGSWISECCVTGPEFRLKFDDAFKSYEPWCKENHNWAFSKKRLGMLLRERGFEPKKTPQLYYIGLALRENVSSDVLREYDARLKKAQEPASIYSDDDDGDDNMGVNSKREKFRKLALAICGLPDIPEAERELDE